MQVKQRNVHEDCGRPWDEHKIDGIKEHDNKMRLPRWICPVPKEMGAMQ